MKNSSEGLSPWGMDFANAVEIKKLENKFDTTLALPGSKSFTNRALVLAAIAKGETILRSPLFSDDSYWCADALSKLGVVVSSDRENDVITIDSPQDGLLKLINKEKKPYIGSAGTIARFLPGIIAARGDGEITLNASDQLSKRPITEMVKALRMLGAEIDIQDDKSFPMTIKGGSLKGGKAIVSGKTSSQFISGLLIASPLAQEPVTITVEDYIVQSDYVRITLALMKEFGVDVEYDKEFKEFNINPQEYIGKDIQLEADASTATYFFALAASTKSKMTITNLNSDTLQPDIEFIDHLKTLGCEVTKEGTNISVQGPEKLTGNKIFDFNACSDSTPALVAIAPFADGHIKVEGIGHIRAHECDRISVMAETLENANISVEEFPDSIRVSPNNKLPKHVVVDPHDDHRMAMAFSVMAATGNGGTILDPSCVSKTCPNFFDLIGKTGVKCEIK